MSFDFSQMRGIAEQVQQRMREMQARMVAVTVEASAGAGMVTVRMNGKHQVLEVKLDPEVVRNDPDMLPDLIRAAVNQAVELVEKRLEQEMGAMAGMLPGLPGLPGMF